MFDVTNFNPAECLSSVLDEFTFMLFSLEAATDSAFHIRVCVLALMTF